MRRFKGPAGDVPGDGPFLEPPVAIAFPQDRMEIEVETDEKPEIVLKAEGGALPLVWLVDGAPIEFYGGPNAAAYMTDSLGTRVQIRTGSGTRWSGTPQPEWLAQVKPQAAQVDSLFPWVEFDARRARAKLAQR